MTTTPKADARIERGKAMQVVFDRLLEEIISVARKPGETLNKDAIASDFGVSKQPVTDAIAKLASLGLVTVLPQVSSQVSWISPQDAIESCFLRSAVEAQVVHELSSSPKPEVIAELRALLAEQLQAVGNNDISRFHELDDRFHYRLFELAGLPGLWQQMETARFHIVRIRRLGLPREGRLAASYAEHEAVVDEIEAGRPRKAANAISKHIRINEKDVRRLQKDMPQYFL